MRKEEFLTALRAGLTGLLPEGVEKLLEFCSEMIDDRMEDGLTEEEAVAAAGSLDELIQQAKTELLPVKTANFTEKSTFGDTLRTYTAESSICGIIANCDYTADFKLLPSENGTCRVECMESEKICYSVTTENNVLHIECADRRTLFSRYKFQKLSVMQLYAFICRRVHINHLKLKQQVVTLLFRLVMHLTQPLCKVQVVTSLAVPSAVCSP